MENPMCSMDKKFDECSSSSTAVVCEKDREQVSFEYGHFDSKAHSRHLKNNMLNKHRWVVPYCTVAAVLIACGALLGLVAVYVELCHANSILESNRDLIHAQDLKILNQTIAMERFRMELSNVQGPGAGRRMASSVGGRTVPVAPGINKDSSAPGSTYVRWGVTECPNTSTLIYSGVAASGSSLSLAKGSGSNYLCMTSDPEYGMVVPGRQEPRARIYSVEYRNGNTFGDQSDLHGHDVPCVSCMASGRQGIIMIPGKASCPTNWTLEYGGILMASRHNNMRTAYICVDSEAVTRPGTMTEDGNSSLLFPVEGVCGSGGGLPCGPYVDGNELQCAVCSR
ncbi:uncharacterized protein [Diadema antillarum]|uniref:uncharacterized protein n=1 Tax=Diadema antillarum TaxID=105358 RepID=UPI003A843FF0